MTDHDAPRATPTKADRALTLSARAWTPRPNRLGIAIPFVVSLVCALSDLSILFLPWLTFLLGVASATLLRSWRALLVVPVALTIGALPGIIVSAHGLPDATAPGFIAGVVLFVLLGLISATIGAAIGVPLGRELERLRPVFRSSQSASKCPGGTAPS
jgi:hypothetical protein